jgi:hypothetical protein
MSQAIIQAFNATTWSLYLISDTEIRGPFDSEKEAKRWQRLDETLVQAREEDIKVKGLPIVSWPFNNSFNSTPVEVNQDFTSEQQRLFEHLYRKCTCGSGDVWSECNGRQGDSSYCG